MLFAIPGDTIACISRKESTRPKMTAKLTIGSEYLVKKIRFRSALFGSKAWGYVTVDNDRGKSTSYPLHRFEFRYGAIKEGIGERVFICRRCYKQYFYHVEAPARPTCVPCESARITQHRPILLMTAISIEKPKPRREQADMTPGKRKIQL